MKRVIKEVVKLEKLVPGGQAIGNLADGRKVFVWGALPGETALIRLTKLKKTHAEAIVTEVIKPSPDRIAPRDDCFLATSPWQIMTESAESRHKVALVKEAFRQHRVEIEPNEIVSDGRYYHYRNKMEYSLWWDHQTERIYPAFHQRGSHRKIAVQHSSIERVEIWQEANRLINQLNSTGAQARHYQSIMIRCDQAGQVSSAIFAMNQPHPQMKQLSDTILGHRYTYSPNGFFQINLPVYQLALQTIKPFITTNQVVDMYAGVGTIGLSVARDHQLALIETDRHAFSELEHNLPDDHPNITTIHARSEEALEYITPETTIIVDPPRAGLDSKLVARLAEVRPPRLIYLSCNPITQARDIARLASVYRPILCQPFNFFPRTPHIENLVVLDLASD